MNQDELLKAARRFRREIVAPNAAAWERERRQPVDALKAAAAAGLTRIETPVKHGGWGLPYSAKMKVAEELARGDMAFCFSLINTGNLARKLAVDGTPEQAARYVPGLLKAEIFGATALTEPGAGSDFSAITTAARKTAEGWVLTGEKAWITNAGIADVFVVYAQTDPSAGWRGIACFLVDEGRDGFERVPSFQLMGGHAIGAGGFRLTEYFVPAADVIHPPGQAFKEAMASINGARTYVAAMCCGMVADALAKALRYGAGRQAFGKPLNEHQGWRWSLADVATQLEAARLLVSRAASLIDAGENAVLAASQAKSFAPPMAIAAIESCIQAMGANGLREEHGLGRHLACAKIAGYVDGSTEMQKERISASLMQNYGEV